LKTEVEKGFMTLVISHEGIGPKRERNLVTKGWGLIR
jgi:hypothetical protein